MVVVLRQKGRRRPKPVIPASPPKSLTGALKWVLDEMAVQLKPIAITGVRRTGRKTRVTVRGNRKAVVTDRLELLTLVRDLWGEDAFGYRLPRFFVHGQAFNEYVAQLAKESRAEARALYVHIEGSYELPLPKDHRLTRLFPKPIFATCALNEANSGGAMVKRALQHAQKGSLIDRLAAINVIDFAVSDAAHHRNAEVILASVNELAKQLLRSTSPLLKESGWLLARRYTITLKNMAAWAKGTWLKG